MNITVDQETCQGHARCTIVGRDLFDLDDEGKAVVLHGEVPPELVTQAEAAVANCPERAIKTST